MKGPPHHLAVTTAVLLGAGVFTLVAADEVLTVPLPGSAPRIASSFSRQPLGFERNVGQVDPEVQYLARGPGYQLFLTGSEAVMVLTDKRSPGAGFAERAGPVGKPALLSADFPVGEDEWLANGGGWAKPYDQVDALPARQLLRMRLAGANASPAATGDKELRGKVNYFIGNDPNRWRTNIPTFAKVQYRDVYPGTDLVYYGNQEGRLEYDFVLAPGADPDLITLEFDGADRIEVDASGDLVAWVGGRPVRWQKPVVYQELNGRRTEIAGAYRLDDGALAFQADASHRIGFELAAYDRSQPLVIDPVLVYSTYLGGSEWDRGSAITTDVHGNAVVVGSTASIDFPTRVAIDPEIDGGSDAFVAKLSSSGELLYASYLGGASWDHASAVQLDSAGNIHLAGSTQSTNFPILNPLQSALSGADADVFVILLNPEGSAITFSTYLGGTKWDYASSVALDPLGNCYVTGPTRSEDFPMLNALYPVRPGMGSPDNYNDFFVTKLEAGGKSILYSTYFGGSSHDFVEGITADAEGHAYIVCSTSSFDMPVKDAVQPFFAGQTDMYYAKILPDGSDLVYGSYFGGDDFDGVSEVAGVALGPDGALWLAGQCNSRGLATSGAFQTDFPVYPVSILARFNATNGSLVAATYFDSAYAEGIAVDAAGDVWIGGRASETLTLVNPIQPNYGGSGTNWVQAADGYVAKFSSDCSTLLFSTYFGGAFSESITSLAVDPKRDLLFVGAAGHSEGFPIVNAFQPKYGGGGDAFVARISMAEVLKISRTGQTVTLSWPTSATNFVLEATTSLPAVSWDVVTNTPTVTTNERSVQLPLTGNAKFFRLRQP